jgi:hypothetical protein
MKLYQDTGWWEERNEQDIDKMLKGDIYNQKISTPCHKGLIKLEQNWQPFSKKINIMMP